MIYELDREDGKGREIEINTVGEFVRASVRVPYESRENEGKKQQAETSCAERQCELTNESNTFWTI
jgi:hypothetical protein